MAALRYFTLYDWLELEGSKRSELSDMSDTALTSPLDSQEGSDSRTLHNVREVKTHVLQQLTELESERVKHYEPLVAQNSTYWDRFQAEMTFGYGKIVQLQQFLLKRLEAVGFLRDSLFNSLSRRSMCVTLFIRIKCTSKRSERPHSPQYPNPYRKPFLLKVLFPLFKTLLNR